MPLHPLYNHTRYILLDQLSHVFFFRGPQKVPVAPTDHLAWWISGRWIQQIFQSTKGDAGTCGRSYWRESHLVTLPQSDAVPGLVYGNWARRKTLKKLESRSQKAQTAMNSCLVLYGWHAENDGRHVRVGNLAHLWEGFYEIIVSFIPFNILRGYSYGRCSKCPSKQGWMKVWRRFLEGCPAPSPEYPFSYTSQIVTKYRLMVFWNKCKWWFIFHTNLYEYHSPKLVDVRLSPSLYWDAEVHLPLYNCCWEWLGRSQEVYS